MLPPTICSSCRGHSGSGKTEAAKKIVEFLSSLGQKQAEARGAQVRSGGSQRVISQDISTSLWLLVNLPKDFPDAGE